MWGCMDLPGADSNMDTSSSIGPQGSGDDGMPTRNAPTAAGVSGDDNNNSESEEPATEETMAHHKTRKSRLAKVAFSLTFTIVLGITFLFVTCFQLVNDRAAINNRWTESLETDTTTQAAVNTIAERDGATLVNTGTYLENLREIDAKNSLFRSVWIVWFSWEGNDDLDFTDGQFIYYNGSINKVNVLRNEVSEEGVHYQQLRVDVTISQAFHTARFPLDNHLLRLYIQVAYPVSEVLLTRSSDTEKVNQNINVYNYEINRAASTIKYVSFQDNHDDPMIPEGEVEYVAEYMDIVEVNRAGFGLYAKCFIAIWGTTLWVLIMLHVATRHRVDVFSMIPSTLFGAVGNILIGAALLPEALGLGLLEYGNIWGIFIVLSGTVTITIINRERNHWKDNAFADKYGRFMFYAIVTLAIIGNIALPLCAFQF